MEETVMTRKAYLIGGTYTQDELAGVSADVHAWESYKKCDRLVRSGRIFGIILPYIANVSRAAKEK